MLNLALIKADGNDLEIGIYLCQIKRYADITLYWFYFFFYFLLRIKLLRNIW